MAKKSLVEEFIEFLAEFIGGFLILSLILLPIVYMTSGWEGVAIILFVVAIIGLCLITAGSNDKKDNKYNKYEPVKKVMKKCPYCGKEVPDNAIRCRYCKRMFENKYAKNKTKTNKNWEDHQKTIYHLKDCPHCSHRISEYATRCPFCKKKV